MNLLGIYHDLQKVSIPQCGREDLYAKFMDDLHQAALREVDYLAAVRRLNSEHPESIHLDGDDDADE